MSGGVLQAAIPLTYTASIFVQDLTAAKSVFQGDVKDIEADPVAQMELCPTPIIGAINGHAVTAGKHVHIVCMPWCLDGSFKIS